MISDKPILVTGSPRAGTSWVGRMISHAPFVRYIHEPLNIDSRLCRCGIKFEYWFHYLTPENSRPFQGHLKHTFFPSFNRVGFINLITTVAQTRRIRPMVGYLQSYLLYRALVKDPLAVFSAETLADLFNMDVIVLIRHPAAIVSSYKALGWNHPFSHFLSQEQLMQEHLFPFRHEIEDFAKKDHDIVDQIALLWKLIHHMILKFQRSKSDWVFVRFEDLARDPKEGFRNIFERTRLSYSKNIEGVIQAHSLQNWTSNAMRPYAIKQNSQQVISKWRMLLTTEEVYRIRKCVESVSAEFYSEHEWNV